VLAFAIAIAIAIAIAMAMAGCTPAAPVPLLTGDGGPIAHLPKGSCYTNFASGPLHADPDYGTVVQDFSADTEPAPVVPVMWPIGYTARRSGTEIEVLDGAGRVVAKTGHRYQIEGGYVDTKPPAFLACGYVLPK
jgi:hypothetical protein